jgi:hypothetical protein
MNIFDYLELDYKINAEKLLKIIKKPYEPATYPVIFLANSECFQKVIKLY